MRLNCLKHLFRRKGLDLMLLVMFDTKGFVKEAGEIVLMLDVFFYKDDNDRISFFSLLL